MTMPDRIRESVQAAVEQPVDVHELLWGARTRGAQRSRFAPVMAAAAVVVVAAGVGVAVQERGKQVPTPAEPSATVVPFAAAALLTEGDVPAPKALGASSGDTGGCTADTVTARVTWTADSANPGDLRGQVRIKLNEGIAGGCGLDLGDPAVVLLGPADGPVGPESAFVGQPSAPLSALPPSRYVSPTLDVTIPLAFTGSNCVPSTAASIVGMGPSFIEVVMEGDPLPCESGLPARDGTLVVGLPRTEGTPAALPPVDRQNLRVTLELPDSFDTAEPLRYLVRLTNPTPQAIPLQPCPVYAAAYGVSYGQGGSQQIPVAGRLNCDAAPPAVPAGEGVVFEMIQQPFAGGLDGKVSGVSVQWGIAGAPLSRVARVRATS